MAKNLLYVPPTLTFFKGDVVRVREVTYSNLNSYKPALLSHSLREPLIAPVDGAGWQAGELTYNLFGIEDYINGGTWRTEYESAKRRYHDYTQDAGFLHARQSSLELVRRGDMWNHYHDSATTWKTANDETNYLLKAGIVTSVPRPHGLYEWSLGSMMAAIEWGVGHAIRNYTLFSHYTEYPVAVGIPEVGARLRQETLDGMKTWREEFPDRAYDYVRAHNLFYWQSRGHKRPPLVVSFRNFVFPRSTTHSRPVLPFA